MRSDLCIAALHSSTDECLIWPFKTRVRYPKVFWEGQNVSAHRLVCYFAHGDPPFEKAHAAHSCGNQHCLNPRHLRWASAKENILDKQKHGTQNQMESHPCAKLTAAQVTTIRQLAETQSVAELARQYHVRPSTIFNAVAGRTWKKLNLLPFTGHGVARGNTHHKAKLTGDDVGLIRQLAAEGISFRDLSKRFQVTDGAIRLIVRRKTWKHI